MKSTLPNCNAPVEVYFEWFKELQYACENVGERYPPTNASFFPHFPSLVNHVHKETITRLTCIDLIKLYLQSKVLDPVDEVVLKKDYRRLLPSDLEFNELVESVLSENTALVTRLQGSSGKSRQKHFNKIRNILMTKSNKRISLADAEAVVSKLLPQDS